MARNIPVLTLCGASIGHCQFGRMAVGMVEYWAFICRECPAAKGYSSTSESSAYIKELKSRDKNLKIENIVAFDEHLPKPFLVSYFCNIHFLKFIYFVK